MTVIRIPDWSEILHRDAPWGLVLRSGTTGAWLLRQTAEEAEGVDAAMIVGRACATSRDLFAEWRQALGLGDESETGWDGFLDSLRALRGDDAHAILVTDAERVLEAEPSRLPTLLAGLGAVASEGPTLRVVFQSRFEHDADRLAVFHEHGVVDIV